MKSATDNPSQQVLEMLPSMLRPEDPWVNTLAIRSRLNRIDRQELLLVLAKWLYDHRDEAGDVAFELSMSDLSVFIEDDEVIMSAEVTDPNTLTRSVVDLQKRLDELVDAPTEKFLENVLLGLNKVGWDMPEAWHVLERHVPTDDKTSATQWLDSHRAAWDAQQMEHGTALALPEATPRPRRM